MSLHLHTTPLVTVPGGTVPATHRHPSYGPCVVVHEHPAITMIRTSNGSALVPRNAISRIA